MRLRKLVAVSHALTASLQAVQHCVGVLHYDVTLGFDWNTSASLSIFLPQFTSLEVTSLFCCTYDLSMGRVAYPPRNSIDGIGRSNTRSVTLAAGAAVPEPACFRLGQRRPRLPNNNLGCI